MRYSEKASLSRQAASRFCVAGPHRDTKIRDLRGKGDLSLTRKGGEPICLSESKSWNWKFRMTGPACPKIHDAVLSKLRTLGLPRGARVLDAPCGDGELSVRLAHEGYETAGADIESALLPEARTVLGDRYRIADLNGPLPWPDSSFDLIVSVEGIEHLENAFAFFREAYRICRPGGILLVTTPNIVSLRSRIRYFGSSFYTQDPRPLNESSRHPLHHIGLRTFWEWRYILHTTGFRLIDASSTHVKWASIPYAIYAPWTWLYTRIAFRKEKEERQRRRNREILRTLSSPSLLFGENILLVAQKAVSESSVSVSH
jgi:SAM-dependent methyltransferase